MSGYKKIYSFDERKDAEEVANLGFTNKLVNPREAGLLAKYYRNVYGFGAIRLEKTLVAFCKEQEPDFNPVTEAESIKRWVRNAMQNRLRKVDTILITHAEMDVIKAIKDLKHRKILFVTLVLAKAVKKGGTNKNQPASTSDKHYLHYSMLPKIADMMNFRVTELGVVDVLSNYIDSLVTPYSAEKECFLVNYVNPTGPVAMTITDPDKALEFYNVFFEGELVYCPNCGDVMKKTGNRQERCKKCSTEIRREKSIEKSKKYRDKKRVTT
jgi:hypothetical protein